MRFLSRNLQLKPQVFAAATDVRFLRALDIPALGFAPIIHTPILAHAHNEYLNKDIFLRGIDIYYNVILAIANVKEIATD